MKTFLIKYVAISGIALMMLASCKKEGTKVVSNGGKAGALSTSSITPVLDKTKLTDTTSIVTFSFKNANYGYSAAVTNTLQLDAPGDNWANPSSVVILNKVYSKGYSTADFNNLLLKLNLPADVASQVNVRIAQSVSSAIAPVYSNVLTLTATPFNLTSWLYVVGQFNGYSTATPDSLISVTGNGIYTGIINFTAGNTRFLILPAKNYNTKYATTTSPSDNTGASITYATEFVTGGGNDLYAPTAAGNYIVTLNTSANTVSIVPANTYSIIGTVTPGANYSTDEDLTKYVNDGSTGWVGVVPMTQGTFPGAFKIRQNHDWTFSWGVPQAGSEGDGIASTLNDTKNDNIPVSASGTYKVTFNIPISAVGATPPVLATYTLTKQ